MFCLREGSNRIARCCFDRFIASRLVTSTMDAETNGMPGLKRQIEALRLGKQHTKQQKFTLNIISTPPPKTNSCTLNSKSFRGRPDSNNLRASMDDVSDLVEDSGSEFEFNKDDFNNSDSNWSSEDEQFLMKLRCAKRRAMWTWNPRYSSEEDDVPLVHFLPPDQKKGHGSKNRDELVMACDHSSTIASARTESTAVHVLEDLASEVSKIMNELLDLVEVNVREGVRVDCERICVHEDNTILDDLLALGVSEDLERIMTSKSVSF